MFSFQIINLIKIDNARGMNALSVAEFAVAMILNAVKGIPYLDKTTREGKWERFMGRDIAEKTVGLIGYGAIARYVAGMLRGFGVKLLAYDPYPDTVTAERQGVILIGCDNLLRTSDIVSLHLPCNSETYHFMNDKTFDMMKDGSYLVNTARGAVIDSDALYRALVSGKLSGASLDVYEQEPTSKDNPLFSLPNVICTPHSAAETYPLFSLDVFRRLYKPYYKKVNDWIHENTSWKAFFHSCGSISVYLDDFVDMGVDILNPVQCSAKGMDARMLKDRTNLMPSLCRISIEAG